jgi:hypothetical protein
MRGLRSVLASYVTLGSTPTTLHDEEPDLVPRSPTAKVNALSPDDLAEYDQPAVTG